MLITSLVQKYASDSLCKQLYKKETRTETQNKQFGITLLVDLILAAAILAVGLSALFCGWLPPAASYSMIGVGGFYLASHITMYIALGKKINVRNAYIKWVST